MESAVLINFIIVKLVGKEEWTIAVLWQGASSILNTA
ncbi:hypothetical protein BACCAC_00843 [Bacteroides caccae ATCC 43185]|nr:hypothetical protein BACCAC_00843 [Bacteroides caccae ATCC 43185]